MKTLKRISQFFFLAILAVALTSANSFGAGTASASETAAGGETCGCIGPKKGTGGLTIKTVEVTDLFGNKKVLVEGTDYTVTGATSTSPSIKFTDPLKANAHVFVEMTTGNKGNHGYIKMELKKATSRGKCPC